MLYFDLVAIICCLSFSASVFYLLIVLDKEQRLSNWGHGVGIGIISLFIATVIAINDGRNSVQVKCPVIHMDNNSYAYIPELKKFLNLNESTKENWEGEKFVWADVTNKISDSGLLIFSEQKVTVKRLTPDEKRIDNDKTTN